MNKENKLPKYWCVKNDGSQLFKDTVVKYLNKTYNKTLGGTANGAHYGFFHDTVVGGSRCSDFTHRAEVGFLLQNGNKQLTIQEFIKLTTEEVEFKDDFNTLREGEKCFITLKSGYFTCEREDKPTLVHLIAEDAVKYRKTFYYFKTKEKCQAYLDSIHNKNVIKTPILDKILNDGLLQRTLAIEEIKSKLSKHYDKHDVEDIMQILTK